MIDADEARSIVASFLAERGAATPESWTLREFTEGWIVTDSSKKRGAVRHVVERSSGRILEFPSVVPTSKILNSFSDVVGRARQVEP